MTEVGVTIERARSSIGEVLRFVLVGVLSNVAYFGVLGVLTYFVHAALWLAGAIAYATSLAVNYLLQRAWTFRSDRGHVEAGPRYLAVQLVALGMNSALLDVLVTRLHLHFLLGQGAAILVTMTWNYLCGRFWVFPREREPSPMAREPSIVHATGEPREGRDP